MTLWSRVTSDCSSSSLAVGRGEEVSDQRGGGEGRRGIGGDSDGVIGEVIMMVHVCWVLASDVFLKGYAGHRKRCYKYTVMFGSEAIPFSIFDG